MEIKLTDEQKKKIMEEIHAYYLDERGEDIGFIHQQGLYDLFLQTLAPIIYNKALDDAKYWMTRRLEDVESDFYELYRS